MSGEGFAFFRWRQLKAVLHKGSWVCPVDCSDCWEQWHERQR
jgi:hypothetical protein